MKKSLLLGTIALAVLSLTGCSCERVTNYFIGNQSSFEETKESKQEHKYDDFVVLIANANLSFDYEKCTESVVSNGETETHVYTYDKENNNWYYVDEVNDITTTTNLDIKSFLKQCKDIATQINKDIDDAFKFSTPSDNYVIKSHFSYDSKQVDGYYEFNASGLMTSFDTKETDLNLIETSTYKATYTYYK